MQICWNCEAQQLDGAIFCSECGASLLAPGKGEQKTRTSLNEPPRDLRIPREREDTPPPPPSSSAQEFSLLMIEHGKRMSLGQDREVLIGRADEKRGIVPDVDLSPFGGYDAGVSRRHAVLSLHNKNCVVRDLGSANGTFINNRRVPPNQPTLINHGDELRFGTLITRIEFG